LNPNLKGNTVNNLPRIIPIRLALAAAVTAGLAASTLHSHAQSAAGTISGIAAGGGAFDYTITLTNTGTLSLNSFWYGWTTSGNNLPSDPSSAGNSLGWANTLDANSIMWVNGSGTALAPGHSATFTFIDTSAPAAITMVPSGESVVYVHGIDFTQNSPGDSSPVFSPSLVSVPEPSSLGLLAAGLFLLARPFRSPAGSRKLR
jgi:PEP-CTERM motif